MPTTTTTVQSTPQTTVTTSKQFSLNMQDAAKGLLVAVITPVFTILYSSLSAGSLTFDWKAIGTTALSAGLAYLLKNYLTPSQTVVSNVAVPPSPSITQKP